MKTYKVTFFDKELDVFQVQTYHNVVNQSVLLQMISTMIHTLELHEYVKLECEGESLTEAANQLMRPMFKAMRKSDKEYQKASKELCRLYTNL